MANSINGQTTMSISRIQKFLLSIHMKFSEIAMPLNGLLKKNVPFEWSLECQKAFLILKQRFMEEPVLLMPDQT